MAGKAAKGGKGVIRGGTEGAGGGATNGGVAAAVEADEGPIASAPGSGLCGASPTSNPR